MKLRFTPILPDESDTSKNARNLRTAMEFGKTMKDVPILLIVCGKRDWPFPWMQRPNRVGSSFTRFSLPMRTEYTAGLSSKRIRGKSNHNAKYLKANFVKVNIPEEYGIVAVIPIGYPREFWPSIKITLIDANLL